MDTRPWYQLLYVSSLSIVAIVLSVFYLDLQPSEAPEEDLWYCGVISPVEYLPDSLGQAYSNGKELFKNLCAQCHSRDIRMDAAGPALKGVERRWADYPREDLYDFIRNSQQQIEAQHPRAVLLWSEWQPTVMSRFAILSDEDIEHLLLYIRELERRG